MPIGNIQPPSAGIQEEPTACIKINLDWLSQMQAMIRPASFPEWWGGTLEENRFARQQVRQLMYVLTQWEDCEMATCCEPQTYIYRMNPATGRPERSKDGGVTWTPDPSDVQNQIPLYPPLVTDTSGKTRCDAATNASEHINDLIDGIHNNLATASTIFDLAVGIATALISLLIIIASAGTASPAIPTIATAIWGAAAGAAALGVTGFDSYWDTDKRDQILCMLYCTIGSNGQFTEAQYQNFRTKMKTTLPASPAFDIVMTTINAGGATGLSQMASYGNAADADCASCGCVGCDITTWTRQSYLGNPVGQITARGTDWIEITGTTVPGLNPFNDACVISPSDNACCRVLSIEDVSGGTLAMPVTFAVNCGNPRWPGSSTGGFSLPSADFFNTIFLRGDNGQFHVRVTFTSEP